MSIGRAVKQKKRARGRGSKLGKNRSRPVLNSGTVLRKGRIQGLLSINVPVSCGRSSEESRCACELSNGRAAIAGLIAEKKPRYWAGVLQNIVNHTTRRASKH